MNKPVSLDMVIAGLLALAGSIEDSLCEVVHNCGFIPRGFGKRILQRLVLAIEDRLPDIRLDTRIGKVLLATRVVSLSSMVAAASAPIVFWLFFHSPILTGMSLFIALMIVLRHRGNIQRLLSGTEPRLGTSSSR